MASLSQRDLERIEEFLRGLYAQRRVEPLIWYVLAELPKLVGTNQTSWNIVVPALHKADVMAWPAQSEHEKYQSALERNMPAHPLIRRFLATGDVAAWKISDFVSEKEFHNTALYDELYHHLKYEDQFAMHLRPLGPQWATVVVARDRRTFTERDRRLLNVLRPHIAQAYRQTRAISRLARRVDARRIHPATSRIMLDRSDEIVRYPARAQRWIEQYFDDLPSAPRRLPGAVEQWLNLARVVQKGAVPDRIASPLVARRSGRQLVVYLFADDDAADQTVLVLEERSDSRSVDRHAELRLTPREFEILFEVEKGKHNDEIALELGIQARTVKKHLEHIFDKLDVDNRTAAVARLREVTAPCYY